MVDYALNVKNVKVVVFVNTLHKEGCVEYVILQRQNVNMGFGNQIVENVGKNANMENYRLHIVKNVKGGHVHVIIRLLAKNIHQNDIIPLC
jgi:hypothetical protein